MIGSSIWGVFFFISPILRCRQSGYNPFKDLAKFGYELDMKLKNVKYPSLFWLSTRKRKRKADNSWFCTTIWCSMFLCNLCSWWLRSIKYLGWISNHSSRLLKFWKFNTWLRLSTGFQKKDR
jgi:hypothetical protein